MMNALSRLSRFETLEPGPVAGWQSYFVKTPTFAFSHFVCERKDAGVLVLVSLVGEYDNRLVMLFLDQLSLVREFPSSDSLAKRRLETPLSSDLSHLLILGPEYHRFFDAEDPDLSGITVVAFPIHELEFSGRETPDEMITLRHKLVSTSIWEREVTPIVRMRFANPLTQVRTIGKTRGFKTLRALLLEVRNLLGVEGGWIEIENQKGEILSLESSARGDFRLVRQSQKLVGQTLPDVEEQISLFCHGKWAKQD